MAVKTFLEICQRVEEEAGISGKIVSVVGQQGEFLRVVNWVKRATSEIDSIWFNWNYLHRIHSFSTVTNVRDYPAPGDHNFWDTKTFKLTAQEENLVHIEYRAHKVDPTIPELNEPDLFTILPTQAIRFIDIPDAVHAITAEYWVKSPELVENTDEPLMPVQIREIIVFKALSYYANYESADEVKIQALENYKMLLDQLQSRELPEFRGASNLQSGADIQVTVPYFDSSSHDISGRGWR